MRLLSRLLLILKRYNNELFEFLISFFIIKEMLIILYIYENNKKLVYIFLKIKYI